MLAKVLEQNISHVKFLNYFLFVFQSFNQVFKLVVYCLQESLWQSTKQKLPGLRKKKSYFLWELESCVLNKVNLKEDLEKEANNFTCLLLLYNNFQTLH